MFPLGAFIPSRFVAGQVVDVVLVQFTQFRADTGNVLIHLASEIEKTPIHLRAQATNSLEYNNRKNSNILEMFIKMMIDSKAGLFHKPKSIQKKQPPATPIYISCVYLQVCMGFGFLAFMPGQWVWETPLCSGVDLSHESQPKFYHILLLESKLPFWRFLPHFLMYSDANNSAGIRST